MRLIVIVLVAGALIAGNVQRGRADSGDGFSVEFADCVESIGVGLVPIDKARALVPPAFVLVGEGGPVTPFVMRTADCGSISVDGFPAKAGSIVQVGAVIVPPDFTGDINNYTILYYTSDAKLAHHLIKLGVGAQHVPTLTYDYAPAGGELHVAVHRPGAPTLTLDGTVIASDVSAGTFRANWWQATQGGTVKMDTTVPAITIGGANLVLTTNAQGVLGQLIGGESTGFPLLQQFNGFATAQMVSTIVP